MTSLRLDLEWRTTLFTLLLLPALLWLGFWQLDRAEQKIAIAAQNLQRTEAPAADLQQLLDRPADDVTYRRVRLRGVFVDEATLFVDNQIRDGRYGHDVLNLFADAASGRTVLLNRGWIPGDASRRSLPEITVPEGPLELLASIYVPPGEPYLLQAQDFARISWPLLVQSASSPGLMQALARKTGATVYPFELRLLPGEPAGYRRDWPVVNVSPEKHRGYAVQWFTMAAVLLLLFVLRSSNLMACLRGGIKGDAPSANEN